MVYRHAVYIYTESNYCNRRVLINPYAHYAQNIIYIYIYIDKKYIYIYLYHSLCVRVCAVCNF